MSTTNPPNAPQNSPDRKGIAEAQRQSTPPSAEPNKEPAEDTPTPNVNKTGHSVSIGTMNVNSSRKGTSVMNTSKNLKEILWSLEPDYRPGESEAVDKRQAEAKQAIVEAVEGLIGEDVPIFVDGKQVKHGDAMEMDFSYGITSPKFQESCKNIQENGKNLEKARMRKAIKEWQ